MSNTVHTITLTAKDGTQQAFSAIEKGAKADAAALQQMGAQGSASLGQVGQAAQKAGRDFQGIRDGLGSLGSTAFIAGAALGVGLGVATKAASDLNESVSKSKVVFGDANGAVTAFATNAATSLGISKQEAFEATATFGNLFRGIGLGQTAAAGMSTSMVKLASDLASFNNQDPARVLEDLRSGLVGEAEPLRKYGVLLNEATVQQKAMAETGKTSAAQLTEGEKAAARYALILEQTTTAQGDFARTSDGVANSSRIASASIKDAEAAMGTALLPTVAAATHGVAFLAEGIATLPPGLLAVAGEAAGAAAGILLVAGAAAKTVSVVGNTIASIRDLGDLLRGVEKTGGALAGAGAEAASATATGTSTAATEAAIAVTTELTAAVTALAAAFGVEAAAAEAATVATTEFAVAEDAAVVASEALAVAAVETGAAMAGAEVASGGLLATLGPIGLVAAAAAAAYGVYKLVTSHHDETTAVEAADKATQDLITTLGRLSAAGSPFFGAASAQATELQSLIDGLKADLPGLQDQLKKAMVPPQPGEKVGDSTALQAQIDLINALVAGAADAEAKLSAVYSDTGTGADLARQRVAELFAAFDASPKAVADVKALDDGIVWVGTHLGNYDDAANAAADAIKNLAISNAGAADAFDVLKKAAGDLTVSFADTAQGQKVLADLQVIATSGTEQQRLATQNQTDAVIAGTMSFDAYAGSVHLTASALEHQAAALAKTAQGSTDLASAQGALNKTWADSIQGQQTLADVQVIAAQGTEAQIAAAQKFYTQLEAGTKTEAEYAAAIHLTASAIEAQAAAQEKATRATIDSLAAGSRQQQQQEALAKSIAEATQATLDSLAAGSRQQQQQEALSKEMADAERDRQRAFENDQSRQQAYQETFSANIAAQEQAKHTTIDITAEVKAFTDKLDAEAKAAYDAAQALGVLDTFAKQLRTVDIDVRGPDRALGAATDLQGAAAGLDSVLGIFRDIDQMGQRAEQAGSIAEKLVGKPGEWATIDDLLKRGAISQTRYNMAVEDGYRIQQRQKSVEEDLNVIRTKQLDVLNDSDQAYAREIDRISHLSAGEQAAALGFMDATESAKAQNAVLLASQAAMGQLGDTGEATATKIIAGAVATDPYLKAELESIGLISTDHEGNIKVNFPEGKSLNQDVEALTASIDALTVALGGVPPLTTTDVQMTGDPAGYADAVNALSLALSGLDGMTATATVNNVTNNITNDVLGHTFALGGMVSAAGGRMVTVNEGGRETATLPNGDTMWLPSGTTVWPHAASVEGNRGGGAVKAIYNYGHISIVANNPDQFWRQMQNYGLSGR